MFRGQLYAGKLFYGQLFGPEEEVTPQVEIPLEYHGGGGARDERDLVALVLEKWRVVEEARVRKAERSSDKRKARRLEIVELDQEDAEPASTSSEGAVQIVPESGPIVPKSGAVELTEAVPAGKPTLPVIQTLFTPAPARVAPTRSTPVTVISVEDDMDEVMTVLLALEEAGEI